MCKWSKWGDTRIDSCIKTFLIYLDAIRGDRHQILASCCGHGKYPMTIVFQHTGTGVIGEMFSGRVIPRKKRFYKRDKQGVYFIPECVLDKLNETEVRK